MKLTESVRSFQVPATPGTCAWPPSLPSVPTSRATRVTSAAKLESWSTIEFTVVPMRANSPFTGRPSISRAIFWFRSPSATATITRATSVVGRTRSSIRPLTESIAVDQAPPAPCRRARSVMRPSRPMISATRTSSASSAALRAAIWLYADSRRPTSSLRRAGRRTLKSPAAAARRARFQAGERGIVEAGPAVAGRAVGGPPGCSIAGLPGCAIAGLSGCAIGRFPCPAVGRLSRGARLQRTALPSHRRFGHA